MTVIRLAGGLGNQIFQLGGGILFAKKTGMRKIVIDDSSLAKYDAKRENELLKFFDFYKLDFNVEFQNLPIVKFRIPKVLPLNIAKFPFVSDKNFQTIILNPNKNFLLLDGYFQECLTQVNFDEEVQLLKKVFIKNEIRQRDGCVIHIRGGDFIKLGWNSVTPKEYYIKAIETMRTQHNQKQFYVVTEDKDYSKTILDKLNINYEFIGSSMQEDFYLIGSFKFRILSSSTFALLASTLGDNEDSIVIAPRFWTPNHERKIYLQNEIRVEF